MDPAGLFPPGALNDIHIRQIAGTFIPTLSGVEGKFSARLSGHGCWSIDLHWPLSSQLGLLTHLVPGFASILLIWIAS